MMSRTRIANWMQAMVVIASLIVLVGTAAIHAQEQNVTLRVVLQDFAEDSSRKAIEEVIVPGFEALHPGVRVEVTWIPWDQYVEQYVTYYLGGVLPDVVSIGSAGLGLFLENGIIRDIDEYVRGWSGIQDTVPGALDDVRVSGRYYAVPYRLDVRTLTYNMDYFDQAGLDRHAPPTTWDDLTVYARALTRYDSDGSIEVQGYDVRDDIYHVLPFILQAGGDYVSRDGTRTLIAEEPAIEAVTFLYDLIYQHNVAVRAGGNIVNGAVAMQHNSTWLMRPQYETSAEIGIAEPTRHREQATQVHVNRFAISSTSQHPDLAWAWIEYFMEPENLQLVVEASRSIPGRISVLSMEPFSGDDRWNVWLRAALVARPIPGYVPELVDVNTRVRSALRSIFDNVEPVRTALEQAALDINQNILNRAR